MNIITIREILSIRTGIKKAERDARSINAFNQYRSVRHTQDHGWDCTGEAEAFFRALGADLDRSDRFELAGYRKVADKINRREMKRAGISRVVPIRIETTGDESEEELEELVRQAVATEIAFQEVVSETTTKKGGK